MREEKLSYRFSQFGICMLGVVKVQKMVQNDKKIQSVTLHISGTIDHEIVIYGTPV